MKKLLLAVAVSSLTVGSAQAVTIFENGGFTYKLNGDFQIQLRQNVGEDESAYVDFDDLELKNYFSYDLSDNMKAFARVDFDFKDEANGKDNVTPLEEAYVGLQYGAVSGSIGKQNFAGDEFGVEEAYEAPLDEDQFDAVGTSGDDTIRLEVELDNVFLVASYELEAEGKGGKEGEFFDLFASTEFGGLALAAAYQQHTPIGSSSLDTFGVSAAYDFGMATVAADYSVTDDGNTNRDTALYNLVAAFDVTSTTGVAIGMQNQDEDGAEDITGWYANVTYKFPTQKNVSIFAELADTDEDNSDIGYLAGFRVKF